MKDRGDAPFDNDPHPSALSKHTPQRTGEWTWLNDDYRAGTVFITDDPTGEQGAIAEGLRETVARRIVKAHNAVVEAAQLRLLSGEGQASEPSPRPIPPIGPGQDKKGGVPFPRRLTADRLAARSTPAEALDEAVRLLREAKPHLYAVDRKGWCWCADKQPDRDPGDHDPDCKWIADVQLVGGLRVAIDDLAARLSPHSEESEE